VPREKKKKKAKFKKREKSDYHHLHPVVTPSIINALLSKYHITSEKMQHEITKVCFGQNCLTFLN
jgi:hypothetical protein